MNENLSSKYGQTAKVKLLTANRGLRFAVRWPNLDLVRSLIAGFQCHAIQNRLNKNQNRSIDKVQNLGNERRYVYKDPRQDSGQRNISYTRYPKKCFTQIYRDLYGDAMLVLTCMSSNMADGNQQKHLLPSFATKA